MPSASRSRDGAEPSNVSWAVRRGLRRLCGLAACRRAPQANVSIARIETFPIVYPTVGRFKFFEGPKGQPSGRPFGAGEDHGRRRQRRLGPERPHPALEYETLETVDSTIRRPTGTES